MASGYITGYQHMLLDIPELTKENFIKFCDETFYHLDRFGYTVEEAKNRHAKRKQETLDSLEEAKTDLEVRLAKTEDDWQKEYKAYVNKTEARNKDHRETYDKEKQRMQEVWTYVEQIRPHLDYVWKDFKEPELYQSDIMSYEDYKEGSIESARNRIEFRQRDVDKYEEDEWKEAQSKIQDYEAAKKAFLEGETNWISESSNNGQRTQIRNVGPTLA